MFLPDLFPPTPLLLQFFLRGLPQCFIDSANISRSTLFLHHQGASPLHSSFISRSAPPVKGTQQASSEKRSLSFSLSPSLALLNNFLSSPYTCTAFARSRRLQFVACSFSLPHHSFCWTRWLLIDSLAFDSLALSYFGSFVPLLSFIQLLLYLSLSLPSFSLLRYLLCHLDMPIPLNLKMILVRLMLDFFLWSFSSPVLQVNIWESKSPPEHLSIRSVASTPLVLHFHTTKVLPLHQQMPLRDLLRLCATSRSSFLRPPIAVLDRVFHVMQMTTLEPDCSPDHHRVQDLLRHYCRRLLSFSSRLLSPPCRPFSYVSSKICANSFSKLRRYRELLAFLTSVFWSRRSCRLPVLSSLLRLSRDLLFYNTPSSAFSTTRQSLWHFGLRYKPSLSLRANLLNTPLLSPRSFCPRDRICLRPSLSVPHSLSASSQLPLAVFFL